MKKIFSNTSVQFVLTLSFGILLGISLTTTFIYSKNISGILNRVKSKPKQEVNNDKFYDLSLANKLNKDVRILCWVLTIKENHKSKAIHVKNTWGKRCNKLLFMSTSEDSEIGAISLPVKNGRSNLWDKTRFALQFIYNYHFDDADWFLKADDDSYFILENVRFMLSQYYYKTSLYFGHRYASKYSDSGYMAGGGYILSKKALEKFVKKLMHDKNNCRIEDEGAEDLELGICLENHTIFVDERDELKQKRFFPAGIFEHFGAKNSNNTYWYDDMLYYDSKYGGLECCSESIVNLHYISPTEMYKLDYLIYNVHPFGYKDKIMKIFPRKLSLKEIIESSDMRSNATDFQRNHVIYHEFEKEEKFKKR